MWLILKLVELSIVNKWTMDLGMFEHDGYLIKQPVNDKRVQK